jgi:hypothetical protein
MSDCYKINLFITFNLLILYSMYILYYINIQKTSAVSIVLCINPALFLLYFAISSYTILALCFASRPPLVLYFKEKWKTERNHQMDDRIDYKLFLPPTIQIVYFLFRSCYQQCWHSRLQSRILLILAELYFWWRIFVPSLFTFDDWSCWSQRLDSTYSIVK